MTAQLERGDLVTVGKGARVWRIAYLYPAGDHAALVRTGDTGPRTAYAATARLRRAGA